MEVETGKRYRINISRGMKGNISFDCTVELVNGTMEETLAESDRLVKALDERYPAPEV